MELYVARQPIFDTKKTIVAYELLHREAGQTQYTQQDGTYASSSVIAVNFLSLGLNSLTSGKLAFINFTEELLKLGVATLLPKESLVVEILETIEPTDEIISACSNLKDKGYTLALDDFVLRPGYKSLIDLADIIKVDFRSTSEDEQKQIIDKYKNKKIQFLAEKVETEQEFIRAIKLGYSLYQGYFFSKPIIITTSTVPVSKLGYIQLMAAINEDNPDFKDIASAIEHDVALSLETIKLVNSVFYYHRQKITSIQQAVVALGINDVKKWIYLSALRRLGANKPDVLVSNSIIRSKFMELISHELKQDQRSREYAMLGLFSLLDALTNSTFKVLFANLNISEEIKSILIGTDADSLCGVAYALMLAYEKGNWKEAHMHTETLHIAMDCVASTYIKSLEWYNTNILDFENKNM